jgi:hypothetical protein
MLGSPDIDFLSLPMQSSFGRHICALAGDPMKAKESCGHKKSKEASDSVSADLEAKS